MPKLVCLSGMNKGDEYELPAEGEVSVGRSEKNDVCVFDKKSSRNHCKLYIDNNGYTLEDLNSTNGLRVNNVFITGKKEINIGDHIRIGQTVFLLSDRSIGNKDSDDTSSSLVKKQKKYENLLQKTAFQVTKTTALRKLKTEREGKETGFLSFFEREDKKEEEN